MQSFRNISTSMFCATLLIASFSTTQAAANVTYTYDALGRLSTATYDNGLIVTYTYDLKGNLTSTALTGVKVVVLPLAGFPIIPIN